MEASGLGVGRVTVGLGLGVDVRMCTCDVLCVAWEEQRFLPCILEMCSMDMYMRNLTTDSGDAEPFGVGALFHK